MDGAAAMDLVRFMDSYWRISRNPGFNASVDRIRDSLQAAGVANRVEEFNSGGRGWDYQAGTVSFADTGEVLLSRERDRVSLCINSFSTPGVVEAPLVDVGAGTPADYEGKNVKGAVVLGSAAAGQLWQQGVKARGAIGVISTAIAPYIRPGDPAQFAFPISGTSSSGAASRMTTPRKRSAKASLRAASENAQRLQSGPVTVKVDCDPLLRRPEPLRRCGNPGSVKPDERIVMVAHIQEPGANDDGSRCDLVCAGRRAAKRSRRRRCGARAHAHLHLGRREAREPPVADVASEQAKGVQYMFSMDMTGEDVAKTGGAFLIEKQPGSIRRVAAHRIRTTVRARARSSPRS